MNNQKGLALIVIILIAVGILVLGGGAYLWQKLEQPPSKKGCTTEAKICPDGTAVGRTGPSCEFTACPSADKNYLYKSQECAVVKYKCDDDYKPFNDELGCGCEKVKDQTAD